MQKGQFSGSHLTNRAKAGGGMSVGPLEALESRGLRVGGWGWVQGS